MFVGKFFVAGQPDFETKDCHPQMRWRMICCIQC